RGGGTLPCPLSLALLVGGMAGEAARRRKLAKLVTDHFLVDRDGHELLPVIDTESEADEVRQDGAAARPSLDRRAATSFLCFLRLLEQVQVDKRALRDGTCHSRLPLLLRVTRTDDHLVRLLVVAGAGALGRLAPRSYRMTAARSTALTTTMRVIDRVLGNAASQRALALPAGPAGLGKVLVAVVGVRNRTDRAHTIAAQVALLARIEARDHQAAVTADDLDIGTGGAGDLAALARLHLDIVADRTDRHLRKQHCVA